MKLNDDLTSMCLIAICAHLSACDRKDSEVTRSSAIVDQPAQPTEKRGDEQTDWPSTHRLAERRVLADEVIPAGRTSVSIAPMDLSTSVGEGPLEVQFPYGKPAGALLERVAAGIQLRTWPELEQIDVSIETTELSEGTYPSRNGTTYRYLRQPVPRIRITPTKPLADRWYVLSVGPSSETYVSDRFSKKLTDGSSGARFRPGSQLAIREIRTVQEKGSTFVVAEFTERVRVDLGTAPTVTIHGGARCDLAGDVSNSPGGFRALAFSCGGADASSGRLALKLDGIAGLEGQALSAVPAASGVLSDLQLGNIPGGKAFRP